MSALERALPGVAHRLGGDPRVFPEFDTLRIELSKLNHPARPDVDWIEVERLCVVLLQRNGADFQTMACWVLAQSYRFGIAGACDGVALLGSLVQLHGAQTWPLGCQQRLEMFTWLFTQLHSVVRALDVQASDLPRAVALEGALSALHQQLDRQLLLPLLPLHSLRELLRHSIMRLQRQATGSGTRPLNASVPPSLFTPSFRRQRWRWPLFMGLAILGVAGWGIVLLSMRADVEPSSYAPAKSASVEEAAPLASLAVFSAGSAALRADSTGAMIAALARITTESGRLIIISGHTDASGDDAANQRLSLARASAVRDWLQRMAGIPEDCFALQGLAASQPLTSNETAVGRAANRRVEIRWAAHTDGCTARRDGELGGDQAKK